MTQTAIKGNVILPGEVLKRGIVQFERDKITNVYPQRKMLSGKKIEYIDYGDSLISPGFIDIHLHGALGKDVMDCDNNSLKQIASFQAKHGVTGFLCTTMSSSFDLILKAVETVKNASKLPFPSEILGVHIEGPFLSKEKMGAQDPAFIKELNEIDIHLLLKAVSGLNTILTMAPEVGNNMAYIKTLKKNGIIVAIGHSDATYKQALESFKEGISHATHFFNAISGYHPREPGIVGAVFDSKEVTVEVIADGIHLHPSVLRLILSCKGKDKICLVTDSIKAAGLSEGIYLMGDREIEVKGGVVRLRETGVISGSILTLNKAVRNFIQWTGSSVNHGVNMASLNPARLLGLDDIIGSIQRGKYANLVILDKEFNVISTILRGQFISNNQFNSGRGK